MKRDISNLQQAIAGKDFPERGDLAQAIHQLHQFIQDRFTDAIAIGGGHAQQAVVGLLDPRFAEIERLIAELSQRLPPGTGTEA